MKKILLWALLATLSTSVFAQIPALGIKGGVNFATITGRDGSGGTSTSGTLTTFAAGAFLDFKSGALSIQPGIYYTGKGSKSDDQIGSSSSTTNLRYLQVPLNFVYHVPAVIGNVYFGAGPFAAYGLSAKTKGSTSGTDAYNIDLSFGNDASQIKRMEYGLQGVAGFHFTSGFLVGISYDLGLSNVVNDSNVGSKNRVIGASVGFTF